MTAETEAPRVATAVTTIRVRQGEEGAFAGWLTELNETVATFPGYISAVVIPPVPPLQADWVLVQRFQTLEQLGAWLDSDAEGGAGEEGATDSGRRRGIGGAWPFAAGLGVVW